MIQGRSKWTGNVSSYGGPVMQGSGNAGRDINNYYGTPPRQQEYHVSRYDIADWDRLNAQKKDLILWQCLRSLSFAGLGSRRAGISDPVHSTCQWLVQTSIYQDWYSSNTRAPILWIKGKPGSGKSVCLKHTLNAHQHRAATNLDRGSTICLSFFFNAQGSELERNASGLYRTLLGQLIASSEDSLKRFAEVYAQRVDDSDEPFAWKFEELSAVFLGEISIFRSSRIEVFIDAVDECQDEAEARAFVRQLSGACDRARTAGTTLRICLSSQYYPNISVRNSIEIRMELHNKGDIDEYVSQELFEMQLADKVLEAYLQKHITGHASDVFLWVKLTCQQIAQMSDQGFSNDEIKRYLDFQQVQGDLDKLFANILDRIRDQRRQEALSAFQLLLCSKRPLSSCEMRTSMALLLDDKAQDLHYLRNLTFSSTNYRKYLIDISGGLLEIVEPTPGEYERARSASEFLAERDFEDEHHEPCQDQRETVQFVHEAIRKFFLRRTDLHLLRGPEFETSLPACHNTMLRACLNFCKLRDFQKFVPKNWPSKPDSEAVRKILTQASNEAYIYIPLSFSHYVIRHMSFHARYCNSGDGYANTIQRSLSPESVATEVAKILPVLLKIRLGGLPLPIDQCREHEIPIAGALPNRSHIPTSYFLGCIQSRSLVRNQIIPRTTAEICAYLHALSDVKPFSEKLVEIITSRAMLRHDVSLRNDIDKISKTVQAAQNSGQKDAGTWWKVIYVQPRAFVFPSFLTDTLAIAASKRDAETAISVCNPNFQDGPTVVASLNLHDVIEYSKHAKDPCQMETIIGSSGWQIHPDRDVSFISSSQLYDPGYEQPISPQRMDLYISLLIFEHPCGNGQKAEKFELHAIVSTLAVFQIPERAKTTDDLPSGRVRLQDFVL